MNGKTIGGVAALLALSVAASQVANAQTRYRQNGGYYDDDTGPYIAMSANRLSGDFSNANDVDFDDSDTTVGFRAGYMFSDAVGLEVGYVDLGNYSAGREGSRNRMDIDATAFNVAAVVNWSAAPSLDLYGKLGISFTDVDSDSVVAGIRRDDGDSSTDPFFALGAEIDLGDFNLFGEFSKVDTDANDLSIDAVSLGIKYEFGHWYRIQRVNLRQ